MTVDPTNAIRQCEGRSDPGCTSRELNYVSWTKGPRPEQVNRDEGSYASFSTAHPY